MGMRKSSDALLFIIVLCCSCCWLLLTTLLHQEHMEPLIMKHEIEHHVQLMNASCASELHAPGALELHAASFVQKNETKKKASGPWAARQLL
jgi:hypothetical protein